MPGKSDEQYENLENVIEDKEGVLQKLQKEAADAVARAAVAVSGEILHESKVMGETLYERSLRSKHVLNEILGGN